MAVYFLNIKTFGRGSGSSAVGAAAYRAGERIRDERTGRVYDHSERQGVLYKEILLPANYADMQLSWARDRASLWNAAEQAETRKNARVAREYLVALPAELDTGQQVDLVRNFSQELADRYKFAVDFALHAPRDYRGNDPRNFHAHVLATTREVTSEGLAGKTTLEWNDTARRRAGLEPGVNEFFIVRERWATVANQSLEAANVPARIDHRSLAERGIDREPRPYIPRAAFELERQGYRSFVAERMRADYDARVAARDAARDAAREAPLEPARDRAPPGEMSRDSTTAPTRSLEDVRREARESWLRMRQQRSEAAPAADARRVSDHGRDDDLTR
jgi:ATP-dependent exoDNAse (exonuclease V) alpha subunit